MIRSGEITGTFAFEDDEAFMRTFAVEQEYEIVLTVPYHWTLWDRFVNSLLWNFGIVNYRLPKDYEIRIPKAKITDVSTSDERISVDWKL